tara:strand:- start:277 stop:873 length:597 start_codon:yes stop_codon:yes gene_type:complete
MYILCIANQKGGTGKSSVTLNIMPHFKPDLVIDADVHKGISSLLKLGNNSTEVRVAENKEQILEWCKESKRILIDCGGFDSDITRYAISQSDAVITPTSDDPTDQFALVEFNKTMNAISQMVDEKLIANVVLNRVHHSRKKFTEITELISDLDHLTLLEGITIPNSSKIPTYAFKGQAATDKKLTETFQKINSKLHLK